MQSREMSRQGYTSGSFLNPEASRHQLGLLTTLHVQLPCQTTHQGSSVAASEALAPSPDPPLLDRYIACFLSCSFGYVFFLLLPLSLVQLPMVHHERVDEQGLSSNPQLEYLGFRHLLISCFENHVKMYSVVRVYMLNKINLIILLHVKHL